jgi:hypothetical protein
MDVLRPLGFTIVEDGPEVEHAVLQLRRAQHPRAPPRARHAGHVLGDRAACCCARHTTTVQARVLESRPSCRSAWRRMGRVYRNEAVDATHLAMFHQFEGIWIDRGLTFAHLKGTLAFVARALFGEAGRSGSSPSSTRTPSRASAWTSACGRVRRRGLRGLPRRGLGDHPRRGHGPPEGVPGVRLRPEEVSGHRVRPRHHAHGGAVGGGQPRSGRCTRATCACTARCTRGTPMKIRLSTCCVASSTSLPSPPQVRALLDDVGVEVKRFDPRSLRRRNSRWSCSRTAATTTATRASRGRRAAAPARRCVCRSGARWPWASRRTRSCWRRPTSARSTR